MACLRLFTLPPLPPLPERSVPRFLRRMALSTVLPAALPYRRPRDLPLELFRELELPLRAISFFLPLLRGKPVQAGCAGMLVRSVATCTARQRALMVDEPTAEGFSVND